jgi:hypothetical protein
MGDEICQNMGSTGVGAPVTERSQGVTGMGFESFSIQNVRETLLVTSRDRIVTPQDIGTKNVLFQWVNV